jgi:hypothetical protein
MKNVALSIKKMGVIKPIISTPAVKGKAKKRTFPNRNSQIPIFFKKYIDNTPAMMGNCIVIVTKYHFFSNRLALEL